jgi:hypothetical protein
MLIIQPLFLLIKYISLWICIAFSHLLLIVICCLHVIVLIAEQVSSFFCISSLSLL